MTIILGSHSNTMPKKQFFIEPKCDCFLYSVVV